MSEAYEFHIINGRLRAVARDIVPVKQYMCGCAVSTHDGEVLALCPDCEPEDFDENGAQRKKHRGTERYRQHSLPFHLGQEDS